jgi:hypothetical protein
MYAGSIRLKMKAMRWIKMALSAIMLVASIWAALHFYAEARLPMTEERYARLCDNQPECYPEIGYLLGALFSVPVALSSAVLFLKQLAKFAPQQNDYDPGAGA